MHGCDDDGVLVEGDTETDDQEMEENEWQVQSDRQQVEKRSDMTLFMEWVRKCVPTACYPEWSRGAQRERLIKEKLERQQRGGPEL